METQRQLKVGRLIQKDLSEIFQKELRSIVGNAFVTITAVKVSPDLSVASVYLSFFNTKTPQLLLDEIDIASKNLRAELGRRIRHQLRIVPELRFFIDNTAEEAQRIEELIKGLNLPPQAE